MPLISGRFSIRSFMIAIAILAGLLALPEEWRWALVGFSLLCLAQFALFYFMVRGQRHLATIGFWSLAILANLLAVLVHFLLVASYNPPGILSIVIFTMWLFMTLPWLAGLGSAWAVLATPGDASHPPRPGAWMWVIALTLLPGVTAWTNWPLLLEFWTARSTLERVADQVVSGQAVSFPQNAGPFRLVGSKYDPKSGGVALLIDLNPGGPSGFVRHRDSTTAPYSCYDPIRGDWYHMGLGGGWCYHEED